MGSVTLTEAEKQEVLNQRDKPKGEPVNLNENLDPTVPLYGSKIFSQMHGLAESIGGSITSGFDPDRAQQEAFMKAAADKALLFAQQFDTEGKYEEKWTDALPFGQSPGKRVQTYARQLAKGTPITQYQDTSELESDLALKALKLQQSPGIIGGFDPGFEGVYRTFNDIAKAIPNLLSGAVNVFSDGAFKQGIDKLTTGDGTYRKKFDTYQQDLEKKDIKRLGPEGADLPVNQFVRAFKGMYKLFDDSPDLPTGADYAEQVLNDIEGLGLTREQANEMTKFGREGASAEETITRLLPELFLWGKATIGWYARGKLARLKDAQKFYDKLLKSRKQSSRPVSEINEEDFSRVLSDLLEDKWKDRKPPKWFFSEWWRRTKQKHYVGRVGAIVGKERQRTLRTKILPDLMAAEQKLFELRKMSPKDKSLIKDANIRVNSLKDDLHRTLPHLYRSAWYTEYTATAGGLLWYELGGGDSFSWIGFLAGGLGGGLTLRGMDKLTTGIGNVLGRTLFKRVEAIASLSKAEREELFKRGKLPPDLLPDADARAAVEDYVIFIRGLPEGERTRALDQIDYFSELKQTLEAKGMDPKLLETTIGRAMNLIPLMILQEQTAALGVNASRGIKGLGDDIARIMELETFSKNQLEMFSRSFKELSEQAEKIGYIGDDIFKDLKANLTNLDNNMREALEASTEEIDRWAADALVMLRGPHFTESYGAANSARKVLTDIINHDLFTRMPKSDSVNLAWSMGVNIEKTIRDGLARMRELSKTGDDFWTDVAKLYDVNVEQSAIDQVRMTVYDLVSEEVIKRSVGSAQFKWITNLADESGETVQAILTKWMRSLYDEDSPATTIYDVMLPQARKSKVLMSLDGMRLSNESTLRALTDIDGRGSVESLLDSSKSRTATDFKNHLLEQFQFNNFEIGGEPVEVVNYGTVKRFFEKVHGNKYPNSGNGASDFDIFRIVERYVEFANVERVEKGLIPFVLPEIKLSLEHVQRLSSAFSRAARETGDNAMQRKYSELSRSIMDSLDNIVIVNRDGTVISNPTESKLIARLGALREEGTYTVLPPATGAEIDPATGKAALTTVQGGVQTLKSKLRAAKDWHLNEIINRFEDAEGNKLGSRIHDTLKVTPDQKKVGLPEPRLIKGRWVAQRRHRDFIVPPDQWIDLDKIIKAGGKGGDEASSLINQLERTFGDYVPPDITGVEGQYVLRGEAKEKVKRILNVLLKREIGRLPHVQDSRKIIKAYTGQTARTKEGLDTVKVSEAESLEAGRKILQDKRITINDLINDVGLKRLENAGLLDLEDLSVHNMSLQKHLGSVDEVDKIIKQTEEQVKIRMDSLTKIAAIRERSLQRVLQSEGIPEAAEKEPLAAYEFFVESLHGVARTNRVIKGLVKQGTYDEKTARAVLGDYVMKGLAKKAYKADVVEGSMPGTGFDAVDADKFFNEVIRNEKGLRNLVGDEVYQNAFEMASMMKLMNRSSANRLSEVRIKFRIPAGLSVESWISRLYSVNRGIISPKYVATEAALLALRKRSATAMAQILSDPKAGEAIRTLLLKGGRVSDKVHMKVQAAIFAALGAVMHSQRESNVKEQLAELRKNPQQYIETNTPTQ